MAASKLADIGVSFADAQAGLLVVFSALIVLFLLFLGGALVLHRLGLFDLDRRRQNIINSRYTKKDPHGRYYASYRASGMTWNEINRLRDYDNKKYNSQSRKSVIAFSKTKSGKEILAKKQPVSETLPSGVVVYYSKDRVKR